MSRVKNFSLTYEALNEEGTFSAGDTLVGKLTFTLTKDVRVKCLYAKVKGDVTVQWSERYGNQARVYTARDRYFKLQESFVEENSTGTVLPQGFHEFKFRFNIPEGDLPASFRGTNGRIVYMLEAKMSRSWRWPCTAVKVLKFVSKSVPHHEDVMCLQQGSVSKEIGVLSKEEVQMSATINRKVCSPGDILSIVAEINNSSSKEVTPKFSLQQKTSYRTDVEATACEQSLCKMFGQPIKPNSKQTVSCQMTVPVNAIPSFHNCDFINVDYYLKVYLDISFTVDPVVEFPLIVVSSTSANPQFSEPVGPYPAGVPGDPSNSSIPPPVLPPAYGYQAPHPTQNPDMTNGYNNQCLQPAGP